MLWWLVVGESLSGTSSTVYAGVTCPSGLSRVSSIRVTTGRASRGGAGQRASTAPKVNGGCRRAGSRGAARLMLPTPPPHQPLAPLDPHKTRALTTIYAPRKFKPRKNKTAQTRMLDELPIKPSLSPFHPLPAIGQKIADKPKTKVIVFDLNKNEGPGTIEGKIKLQDVLKPLTPLRIHAYNRKSSLEPLEKKPQQLLRENTYDVIEPRYVIAAKVKKRDSSLPRRFRLKEDTENTEQKIEPKVSPKTRFKEAALQVAKLTSMNETGKLLCLRERQETFSLNNDNEGNKSVCKLQQLPRSPTQKLTKLSEIFQSLEMKGRHRDKMKKDNSWF